MIWELQIRGDEAILRRRDRHGIGKSVRVNRYGVVASTGQGYWVLAAFCVLQRLFPEWPKQVQK